MHATRTRTRPSMPRTTSHAPRELFGLEEGNVVVRFEAAREDRMFWG
jgi:hypothetical protein